MTTPRQEPDTIQIVVPGWAVAQFDTWLATKKFKRFRIPGLDDTGDLPTFGIGPIDAGFKNNDKGGEST